MLYKSRRRRCICSSLTVITLESLVLILYSNLFGAYCNPSLDFPLATVMCCQWRRSQYVLWQLISFHVERCVATSSMSTCIPKTPFHLEAFKFFHINVDSDASCGRRCQRVHHRCGYKLAGCESDLETPSIPSWKGSSEQLIHKNVFQVEATEEKFIRKRWQ